MRRAADPAKSSAVKPAADAPRKSAAPPSPETAARRLRFLDGALVAVVLVFAFLTALFPVNNSDFFLHAATGRLIAHGEYHFGVDPFAFTTEGVYWVNHGWLYDLILYLLYAGLPAGGTILIVLKALMIAATAEVMLRTARPPGRSLWIPAACVGLAMLALSPRLLLQPVCVSYFFLGVTCWLLQLPRRMQARAAAAKGPPPRRPFLPYWLIPPLCLLWVNLDAWFLLGPITVALFLLGEMLQDWLAPPTLTLPHPRGVGREGGDVPAPGERRTLILVLAASVVLCLANPHHVRAFSLPAELGLSEAGEALAHDAQFSPLFVTPFEPRYFSAGFLSVAGLAYFPLALVGVISFAAALSAGRARWSRLFIWAAFFALSAWHARAIPFFAVVAGPIAALNFLDFAGRRAAAKPAGAGRGNFWALGGRVLTLLTGVVLVALAWPGWLQAQPATRRVGCAVEPNRGMKEMTDRINEWRKDGLIEPGGRWFNVAPDALHYLAWFCPGERGFIDQRLPLYDTAAADYTATRASLSSTDASDPKWRKTMRRSRARYLIWSGELQLPVLKSTPLWRLFASPEGPPGEWPLLFLNGRTAVFGWRDPDAGDAGSDTFSRLEYDADRAAFGADAAPAPPGPTPDARPGAWWSALGAPAPSRPPEADEAAAQLMRFESLRPEWLARNKPAWDAHWTIDAAAACLSADCGYGGPFQAEALSRVLTLLHDHPPPVPSFPPQRGEEREYLVARNLFDFGPACALYLGVRAGRRSLALKPDDAPTYEALAQTYLTLEQQTREGDGAQTLGYPSLIRQAQVAAALRRALDLDPDREVAQGLSFLFYQDSGFFDLALEHARERLRLNRDRGAPEAELKQLSDQVDQLQKAVDKRRDAYDLRSSGQSAVDKADTALQYGLGGEALEVLKKTDWTKLDKDDVNKVRGVERELSLMLRTGHAREVADTLAEQEASLADGLGVDPDTGLPAYEWLRAEAAAATGDYAGADKWLAAVQEKTSRPAALVQALRQLGVIGDDTARIPDLKTRDWTAILVGNLVLREAPSASPAAPWLLPNSRSALLGTAGGPITGLLSLQCDLDAVRGWLVLEAGRTAEARERFEDALWRSGPGAIPFRGRALTRTCLEWLDSGGR